MSSWWILRGSPQPRNHAHDLPRLRAVRSGRLQGRRGADGARARQDEGEVMAIIHHGTPLTPRAALLDICAGRAMCVSFYTPQDVEAVEAISPAIMFRQWRVFVLEAGATERRGLGARSGLVGLLRLAGATSVPSRPLGGHSRYAWRAQPAQRHAAAAMAIRPEGRAALAHGWPDRAAVAPLRAIRPGLLGLDRARQRDRLRRLSSPHGGGRPRLGQYLAGSAHDARDGGGLRLSIHQRRQHQFGAEWVAL